jgi:formylglycine-generating enzyme required for sulfatase activity
MKNQKNRIQVYLLIAIGMITICASSCKKDEPIIKKDPIITWSNPSDINEGTLLSGIQLNATADVAGTFVYTPAIGIGLSVGANQDLKVDFTPSDIIKYNVVSKAVKINVLSKQDPIITWSNPTDITVGTLLSATHLNATADVAGTFVYTPPNGTSLSVGANQDLKVDFTPSDITKYNVVSKTVKINVLSKQDPIITWSNPADITVGTLLSATQLNATSDVAGTFVYTPPIGTSLSEGANQDLKVDFTPTDVTNYNTLSKTVKINVVALTVITYANISAGTFTMGSPTNEVNRGYEKQYQVTLTGFRISKYEITNAQYAAFLNAKSIGSNGIYGAGAYPTETLIYAIRGIYDWGLRYNTNKWESVVGYENHPVINVTWYGATEFATYVGGTLPTEAQWEYACRAGTTTPFNTGDFLTNLQANYWWAFPYNGGTNTVTTYPAKTQAVGTYPANAWSLHDMHGNVEEWCSDWYGSYPSTAQTNPTGAASGSSSARVVRGGGWRTYAQYCRSANRSSDYPVYYDHYLGFRVVLVP